jgi:hypothetical protein
MLDYGGKTAFGETSPLKLAQTQIADQSAAKKAADKAKLDLYSQWGALNPKATNLDHANFVDTIGLDPAVAAQLIGISPEQAQNAYADAKFNKQTGDSLAAYNYLMGKGAYPTKSGAGEIMRPYAEATLGMPANTNRKYVYDQTTGKYNLNPDYVAEYKDPTGGTNYLMSQKEIFNYFKNNAGQDDAITYAWALANNLTPKEISEATGVPISQIAPKWRAAAAKTAADKAATEVKNADGTIDKLDSYYQEQEESRKEIVRMQGDMNTSKMWVVDIDADEEKPEFIDFTAKNYDRQYELTEKTVQNNIGAMFMIPPVLRGIDVGTGFGSELIANAYNFMNSVTDNERRMIEVAFKD